MANSKLPLHKFIATGGKPKEKKTMTGNVPRPSAKKTASKKR